MNKAPQLLFTGEMDPDFCPVPINTGAKPEQTNHPTQDELWQVALCFGSCERQLCLFQTEHHCDECHIQAQRLHEPDEIVFNSIN